MYGYVFGRGMYGYGLGRGFPRPYMGRRCLYPFYPTKQEELTYLKERSNILNEELKWIQERIKTLENQS